METRKLEVGGSFKKKKKIKRIKFFRKSNEMINPLWPRNWRK